MKLRTNGIVFQVAELRDNAYEHVSRELRRLGLNDLAPSHGLILITLYREKALSLKDLSIRINKKKSSTTELVDKLIRLGYVEKTASSDDQRVKLVRLAQESLSHKDDFKELSDNVNGRLYQGFTAEDKRELMRLLNKALANY
ncbi:MarR family transcriptional regulator [Marinobacter sp. M216]|uniref:MarR family transcriptional regulator n=1 Tax=Marinobacter albus TaxID=3030833 RepID=A0ABT7HD08_9GAMM|nr:MarR family transcriptional regulator [Marinobacter sp. M216]MDK9558236.1 MarR family transcriptional regulator [Marinobacter sp. M216]